MPPKTKKSKKLCGRCRFTFLFVIFLVLFCLVVVGYQLYVPEDSGFYVSADGGVNPGNGMFPDGPPNVEPPLTPPPAN